MYFFERDKINNWLEWSQNLKINFDLANVNLIHFISESTLPVVNYFC